MPAKPAGYANPLRKLLRDFLPWLPYARTYALKHRKLHAFWQQLAEGVLAQPDQREGEHVSFAAAFKRLLDPNTPGKLYTHGPVECICAAPDCTAHAQAQSAFEGGLHIEAWSPAAGQK